MVVKFPWHEASDVADAVAKARAEAATSGSESGSESGGEGGGEGGSGDDAASVVRAQELVLEGGVAFGTGEHPTTKCCLEWLQRTLSASGGDDEALEARGGEFEKERERGGGDMGNPNLKRRNFRLRQ